MTCMGRKLFKKGCVSLRIGLASIRKSFLQTATKNSMWVGIGDFWETSMNVVEQHLKLSTH